MSKTTMLKRIDPMSAGKILAAIYGVLGLIIGVLYFVIVLIVAIAAGASSDNAALGLVGGLVGGLLLGAVIVGFYALIGFLAGLISAAIYNVVAKRVGGLKLEIE